MTRDNITAPEGAEPVVWWQEKFDHDFPDGLLAEKKKEPPNAPPEVQAEDLTATPVLRVPRVEVLRMEDRLPHVIFVGQGWDIGVDGLVTSYTAMQEKPFLVMELALRDGPAFLLSAGVSDRLKRLLAKDRQALVGYSQANGKSMHS
jgi:hypothetical protein